MQVNSRDYRPGFLRVAASSNKALQRTRFSAPLSLVVIPVWASSARTG